MPYSYTVVGAGRQGIAAAYDLVQFGEASRIFFVDVRGAVAAAAAIQLNSLVGANIAAATRCDATDLSSLREAIAGTDAILSANLG